MTDIAVRDHGTVAVLSPMTEVGGDWLNANVDPDALTWAGGVVCEPRYAGPILNGIAEAGLSVG